MSGNPSIGAAAPLSVQENTGQYECGNFSSLIWKLSLICSVALVIAVPLIWITNVMKQANSVTLHFFAREKLKGFPGSSEPSHDMLPASESLVGASSIAGVQVRSEVGMTD